MLNSQQSEKEILMGIIIQTMVDAKFSGIIFTCSPINPTDITYRIDCCLGRGDILTGGSLTGNSITLDKKTGKIVQQEGNLLFSKEQINNLLKVTHALQD